MNLQELFDVMATQSPEIVRNAYNWNWISRNVIPDEHILKHLKLCDLDLICRHQHITIELLEKLQSLQAVNYDQLVRNPNLDEDVKLRTMTAMDWDMFQKHQIMSESMLLTHQQILNAEIVLKYQTVPETMIWELLQSYISEKQYCKLKACIDNALLHQKVSSEFVTKVLQLNSDIYYDLFLTRSHTLVIVSVSALVPHCETSELLQYVNNKSELAEFIAHGHFTEHEHVLLELLETHGVDEHIIDALIDSHNMSLRCIHKIVTLSGLSEHFWRRMFHEYDFDHITFAYLTSKCPEHMKSRTYADVLLRILSGRCQLSLEHIDMSLVDWRHISKCHFTAEMIGKLLPCTGVIWRKFVRSNELSHEQILECSRTHPEAWNFVTWFYLTRHKPKLRTMFPPWWTRTDAAEFLAYPKLQKFMIRMVFTTDWTHTLRYESLPEWLLEELTRYADNIDMFWWRICVYQKLSEEFIVRHIQHLDMHMIVKYQDLSAEFLRTYESFLIGM